MMGWRDSIPLVKNLKVDLILFVFLMTRHTYDIGSGNLLNQKVCFPDEQPAWVLQPCNDTVALKEISVLNTVKSIARGVVPSFIGLFAGSWRDHTGLSRPIMLVAHIGEVICLISDLIGYMDWTLSPWITVFVGNGLASFTGGPGLMTLGALSYIIDNTDEEMRTTRISIIMVILLGSVAISSACGGLLLNAVGYGLFLFLMFCGYLLSFILVVFLMRGEIRRESSLHSSPLASLKRFKLIFKKRPNRFTVWLYIISSCILFAMMFGETTLNFQFLQKISDVTVQDSGFLSSYKLVLSMIGAAVITPILKNFLHLSEIKIALICAVPSAISYFGIALSKTFLEVFIFSTLDMMRLIIISTLWALMVSCIDKDEIGVYSSFMGFGEAVVPLAVGPIYTSIFYKTIDILPGAFHFFSCFLILLTAVLVVIAEYYKERNAENEEDDNLDNRSNIASY